MITLGTRLRKLREERKLTQTELSELLGMKTYTTVSKWESDDNFPKGKDLKVLAEIFDVSSDYLLGLSENRNIVENNPSHNNPNFPIMNIYKQLNEQRQNEVVDFAKFKLQEQNKEKDNNAKTSNVKEFPSSTNSKDETIVDDDPFEVFAAHIDDDVTEEEMEEIIAYMKEIKKGKK